MREELVVLESEKNKWLKKIIDFMPIILALISMMLTIHQCFDENFWGDECYSILKVIETNNFKEIALCDVTSPPLLFLMIKFFTLLFGQKYWVYHFTSAFATILLLIFSLTCVSKEFGRSASFIFTLFLTMTTSARAYSVEVRMYAWASLWVVLCFYEGYMLLKTKGSVKKHWILFCLFGLGAAYTHYFAFAAIILLYFFVFLGLILKDKKKITSCLLAIIISILGYLPWLTVFLSNVMKVSAGFWIEEPLSIPSGFRYIFQKPIVVIIFGIVLLILFLSTYSIIDMMKNRKFSIKEILNNIIKSDDYVMWMTLSGCFSALFILIFQYIYGTIKTPVFTERYIYPLGVAIWLSFAMLISNIKNIKIKKIVSIGIIIILCFVYSKDFSDFMKAYYAKNQQTLEIAQMIEENQKEGNVYLLTNINHYTWTVFDYYFDEIPYEFLDEQYEKGWSDTEVDTVFIFSKEKMDDELLNIYSGKIGADFEFVMDSFFTDYYSYIYKAKINANFEEKE